MGEPGDAKAHGAKNFGVVKGHFEAFVEVAVAGIVDDV